MNEITMPVRTRLYYKRKGISNLATHPVSSNCKASIHTSLTLLNPCLMSPVLTGQGTWAFHFENVLHYKRKKSS